jgi:Rieske Fe-S protein
VVDGTARVPLAALDRLGREEVMIVRARGVANDIVVRRSGDGSFRSLLARCTHRACGLDATPDGFDCPCHASRFDRDGRPVAGPATEALSELGVIVREGVVIIALPDS